MRLLEKPNKIKDRLNVSVHPTAWCSSDSNPFPVVIELVGVPYGKGRPRFTRRGFVYTPPKTRAYERKLTALAHAAMRGRKPLDGPLMAKVWAFFPIAASWSAKRRDAALAGTVRPTKRPDWDNLAKVLDALNKIVWKDDSQVVDGFISKRYSESPRLRVEISTIEPPLLSGESDDEKCVVGNGRALTSQR